MTIDIIYDVTINGVQGCFYILSRGKGGGGGGGGVRLPSVGVYTVK